MTSATVRRVVVGVDGSEASNAALDWALEEATREACSLHLIHGYAVDTRIAAALISTTDQTEVVDDVLEAALERARAKAPHVTVSSATTTADPARALLTESANASALVVGTRGRGFAGTGLGSIAVKVATHARCPVIVVPEAAANRTTVPAVVVGSDGSATSEEALAFAFAAAAERRAALHVVHAWWLEFVDGVVVTTPGSPQWLALEQRLTVELSEAVQRWSEKYPTVHTQCHIERAAPATALVEASHNAELLVVGSRGRGGFRGLLLGSVSMDVMRRATCPVAVVRTEA